jgi:hypothetical protein
VAASDAVSEVRAAAHRALSRIDGRPLVGEWPAEPVLSPLEASVFGIPSRAVAWGAFVDPSEKCEVLGDHLEISIPKGTDDLSVERERIAAPRLMPVVDGHAESCGESSAM